MKIIIDLDLLTDNITTLTASSENASFPASNLQNDYTTDLYKAASGTTALLTATVSKGSAVAIINTNATSAAVTAGYGEAFVDQNGFVSQNGFANVDGETSVTTVYDLTGAAGRLWADYPEFTVPHVVKVFLTAASVVTAGILRAGNVEEFADPAYGLSEGSNDYSIEMEMNNGADYFRKRNVVRTFGNLALVETRTNCYKFKHDIFDKIGPKPVAIRLVENGTITDWQFVLFAKRMAPPEIVHDINATKSRINFSLREVI